MFTDLLKRLPLSYEGELHDVRLVNFSVDPGELGDLLPRDIQPLLHEGRALISMVHVHLRNMRLRGPLGFFRFQYRHVGFRLLIDDSRYTWLPPRGIFFLRSFSDSGLWARLGRLFSIYRLEPAHIEASADHFSLRKGGKTLRYTLLPKGPQVKQRALEEVVARIDRAYAPLGEDMRYVQIQRERWPLQAVDCPYFETDFFASARLEGAFAVPEVIHYRWDPTRSVYDKRGFGKERSKEEQEALPWAGV